jgi:hypothetical protein
MKKPFIIGDPGKTETISFSGRHFKIRIYDKQAQLRHLLDKKIKLRVDQLAILKEELCVTRNEIEIRHLFTEFSDSIFLQCENESIFSSQTLTHFLNENPYYTKEGQIHKLWRRLKSNDNIKFLRPRKLKNSSEDRRKQAAKAMTVVSNKFKKLGLTDEEIFIFLYREFIDSERVTNIYGLFDGLGLTYAELLSKVIQYQKKEAGGGGKVA